MYFTHFACKISQLFFPINYCVMLDILISNSVIVILTKSLMTSLSKVITSANFLIKFISSIIIIQNCFLINISTFHISHFGLQIAKVEVSNLEWFIFQKIWAINLGPNFENFMRSFKNKINS